MLQAMLFGRAVQLLPKENLRIMQKISQARQKGKPLRDLQRLLGGHQKEAELQGTLNLLLKKCGCRDSPGKGNT
ncbi:MAG: hypothetical protein QXT25_03945, partial [Candidatus Anstonellaceae archaeon]